MPNKYILLNYAGIVLQYLLVLFLYYFLYRILRIIWIDLFAPKNVSTDDSHHKKRPAANDAKINVIDLGGVSLSSHSFSIRESLSIGRGSTNDVVIEDTFVSTEHACIAMYKPGYRLTDLNSTNGTYVNGNRITNDVTLHNGDVIKIGAITFKFEG